MKQFFLLLFSIVSSIQILFAQQELNYSFKIDSLNNKPALVVDLSFKAADSVATYLQLPDHWASQEQLYRAVKELKCLSKGVRLENTKDSSVILIHHRPKQKILIQYTLQQDWEGELNYPINYRAVINKEYLHFTGYSLLVYPKQKDSTLITVSLDWNNMPKQWNIANSLHTGTRHYKGKILLTDFVNSLYIAGDYRLYTTFINKKPVYVAIRGMDWKFTDSTMLNAVSQVISTERNFWKDHTETSFLVTLTPFGGQGSINGSALNKAFLTCMTTEFPFDLHLYGLLAHEYFHRWNGVEMYMQGAENEQEDAWFGEGFTEYYTYKLLYKGNIISIDEYVQKTNSTLAEYYLSPVKNESKEAMGKNFWGSRDFQMLPYKKGFAYALYLDYLIQKTTNQQKSLDDFMFSLRSSIQSGEKLTEELFLKNLNSFLEKDISQEHHEYITYGKTIPVMTGSMGKEVSDSIQSLSPFELGFDFNATAKTNIISGVVENSNAWKAGLRDGQPWKGGSIYFDNIEKEAEVVVMENGVEKKITYFPKGSKVVEVRQFYLRK